ncbi:hypothetical protein [Streptomyces sp. NBC_00691]|uniref:hypothetical protein n=1 Tax=Streptomyces sp. NBC_00691 TaxID=2903671 RepID=UPI002E37A3E1|nr:hypothetical protein [Streptomyces sp. NBC_00691]
MPEEPWTAPRSRFAGLPELPPREDAPAHVLQGHAVLLGALLAATERSGGVEGQTVADDEVAAALGLFEDMRTALDRLEAQVVIEARRRGMEWRQIAGHQGMKSSQAASQRYQRLVTRLEEIRQGIR